MKSDLDNVLFTSAYLLCLTDALVFGYSTFSAVPYAGTLSMLLRVCAAALVLTKLVFDRQYSLGLLICVIAIGMVLLIAFIKSRYSHVFYLLIIFLGIRNVNIKSVISLDLWIRIVLFLFIVFCGLTGIIENYITYRTDSSVLRYSIGFNHPNTVASLILSFILEEAWLNKRRAAGLYIIVVWIIAATTYIITANRTAVLIMVIFPVALLFVKDGSAEENEERGGGLVFASLFPIVTAFSYTAMIWCRSSGLFRLIDIALSNRFYNAYVIFNSYGIPLMGQQVALVSVKAARLNNSSIALLDVSYLRMLIQAGPIVMIILAVLYGSAMNRAWRKSDFLLVLILSAFVIFGLFESGFNNVFMNFTLLFAAKELFSSEEYMEESALCSDL